MLQISAKQLTSYMQYVCAQRNRQSARILYILHMCDISDLMMACLTFQDRCILCIGITCTFILEDETRNLISGNYVVSVFYTVH